MITYTSRPDQPSQNQRPPQRLARYHPNAATVANTGTSSSPVGARSRTTERTPLVAPATVALPRPNTSAVVVVVVVVVTSTEAGPVR
jgi:hypothetical protein